MSQDVRGALYDERPCARPNCENKVRCESEHTGACSYCDPTIDALPLPPLEGEDFTDCWCVPCLETLSVLTYGEQAGEAADLVGYVPSWRSDGR